jgi:hypothetical protein
MAVAGQLYFNCIITYVGPYRVLTYFEVRFQKKKKHFTVITNTDIEERQKALLFSGVCMTEKRSV